MGPIRLVILIGVALFSLQLMGCKGDPVDKPSVVNFDKAAMLADISDKVIIPSYDALKTQCADLEEHFAAFQAEQTDANYAALKLSFEGLRLAWQRCSMFEFGPAAGESMRLAFNTFPCDTTQVNKNIAEGNANLLSAQNADAKGLPALDFILFTKPLETASQQKVLAYLELNIQFLSEIATTVKAEWDDEYRSEFTQNTGSDVGSSISQLVNELNYDFELLKNAKVGIPLGKKSLGVAQPEKVEAFYSRQSAALILEHLDALKQTFSGADGSGLDDYLNALGAKYESQDLSLAISKGFEQSIADAQAISGSLYQSINDDPSSVESLHASLQNLVVLLKTDMPSQLGVQITYQDNDGD